MLDLMSVRIKYLRERFRYTQQELAEKVGVVSNTVAKWESGALKPSRDKVNKMALLFNTTVDFILGNVHSEKVIALSEDKDLLHTLHNVADELNVDLWDMVDVIKENKHTEDPEGYKDMFKDQSENFINVPVVQLTACAGIGTGYADIQFEVIDTYPINKNAIMGHAWQSDGFRIINIEGDSMEPRFLDGDMVLLAIKEDVRSGDIVVACWDYRFYIRGFEIDNDMITLRPINEKYKDIKISREDKRFLIVGKVIAIVPTLKMVGGYW